MSLLTILNQGGNSVDRNLPINIDEQLQENLTYNSVGLSIIPYVIEYIHDRNDFMPLHWHNELQLSWVYEGKLEFLIDGESVIVDKNSLLFINRKKFHSSTAMNSDAKTLCINFTLDYLHPKIVTDYIEPLLDNPNFSFYVLPLNHHIESYLNSVLEEIPASNQTLVHETDSTNYFQIVNLINLIMEDIVLKFNGTHHFTESDDTQVLNQLLTYIHQNYDHKIKIKDLTEHVHLSKTYCNDLFQKYTHLSPIQYVMAYRLQVAQELVLNTDQSISEISEKCGFSTLSYFVEQFRLQYKLTPLQFRKKFA